MHTPSSHFSQSLHSSHSLSPHPRASQQCIHTMQSGYALSSVFVPGDRHLLIGTKVPHFVPPSPLPILSPLLLQPPPLQPPPLCLPPHPLHFLPSPLRLLPPHLSTSYLHLVPPLFSTSCLTLSTSSHPVSISSHPLSISRPPHHPFLPSVLCLFTSLLPSSLGSCNCLKLPQALCWRE